MELRNDLPFPAHLLRFALPGEDFVRATVVVKQTFDIQPDGSLRPSVEQLPVQAAPMDTPFGRIGGDYFVTKDGVDVCVLATMRLAEPARVAIATLRVGTFLRQLRVSGDRRWIRAGKVLVVSEPEPFREMPLSYARAYGGTDVFRGQSVVWPDNPQGCGYYVSEEHADGRPLPNIEPVGDPPITRWDDRPRAAGWGPYPFTWGLQQPSCMEIEDGKLKRLLPRMFNSAHPDLIVHDWNGAVLRIDGISPTPFVVAIPSNEIRAVVEVGGRSAEALSRLDGVYVWVDARKIVVTRRARFRYPFRRGEARRTTLTSS